MCTDLHHLYVHILETKTVAFRVCLELLTFTGIRCYLTNRNTLSEFTREGKFLNYEVLKKNNLYYLSTQSKI